MSRWARVFAFALVITALGCGDDDTGNNGGKDSGADEGGSGGKGGSSGKGGSGGSGGSSSTGKPDGGMAGSGGMGGSGGSGGTDATPDTGVPDPCADVADKCTVAGTSCDGSKLVTCAKNEDGCLVETTAECAEGDTNYCDDSGRTAQCAACDETDCTEASVSCDGDSLVTCGIDANGCLKKTTADCTAGNNDYCNAVANPPRCAACPNSGCTEAGTSCDGKNLVTCSENANGCLVRTVLDCTTQANDVNTCSDAGGEAQCIRDVCRNADGSAKDDVCVVDEQQCSENTLVTCEADTDGCKIRKLEPCSAVDDPDRPGEQFNYCDATDDACKYDRCLEVANPCDHAGKRCDGKNIINCHLDSDVDAVHPCLVETPIACGATDMCDDPDGPPTGAAGNNVDAACVACSNAPGCSSAGFKDCNDNVFKTCADTDSNGCLELITEDCGPATGAAAQFTCDETDRCKHKPVTGCNEDLDDTHVIRESGTLAGFSTTGEMNEYGGFVCPGLSANLPFQAAGKDILFALEAPANSVVNVKFKNKAGFTGTGVWMMLLPDCKDNGSTAVETTCTAFSDSELSFANEDDITQRVYMVVDADGQNNVGTFDLEVTTRPLGCGDGRRDGSEKCDDGNRLDNDGCKNDCTIDTNYQCTSGNPSVCTLLPTNNVCANVMCDALPSDTPSGADICCTTDQKCGVAYPPLYGNSCIERNPAGTTDARCPGATNRFGGLFVFVAPNLTGCCTPNHECGLNAASGGGCIERSDVWTAMLDGAARVYYDGPYDSIACP